MLHAATVRAARRCGCRSCRHSLAVELTEEREIEQFARELAAEDYLSRVALFDSDLIGEEMRRRIAYYGLPITESMRPR